MADVGIDIIPGSGVGAAHSCWRATPPRALARSAAKQLAIAH
jgi:hypothetical protein